MHSVSLPNHRLSGKKWSTKARPPLKHHRTVEEAMEVCQRSNLFHKGSYCPEKIKMRRYFNTRLENLV